MSRWLTLLLIALTLPALVLAAGEAPLDVRLGQQISSAVAQGSLGLALLIAFGAGVVVSLSPCVYPLIPVTIAVFGAREAEGYLKGFLLSLCYVLGMAIFYSAAAVVFSLLGMASGSLMAMPAVVLTIAGLGALMAASLFGAFELNLPVGLQTKLAAVGGTGYRGAFLMGLVAGVVAAPCSGPVLLFILALIAQQGDLTLGVSLMVAYALGIGLLFLIVGTFSQVISRLPKSGAWMETARSALGLGMLLASLYVAAPHLGLTPAFDIAWDPMVALAAAAALLFGGGLGALHLSFHGSPLAHKLRKGLGLMFATVGAVALVGLARGADRGELGGGPPAIAWQEDHDAAVASARQQGRPVMIDFGAEWCTACKELEHRTLTAPQVRLEASRFVAVKVDCTEIDDGINALWARYGIRGLPNIVFLDSRGALVEASRVTTFLEPELFVERMRAVR